MVEDCGDPVRGELADPRRDVLAPGDRYGAQLPQPVVVATRGSTDDPDTGVAGKLHERRADTAVRAEHPDRLTWPAPKLRDAASAMRRPR